jgi:hypothetical protein
LKEGWTLKVDALHLACAGADCKASDVKTCADKEGFCKSLECPKNYLHRHDADKVA